MDTALDQIVIRTLAIDPKERYPSAKELLESLAAWKPQPVTVSTPPQPGTSSKLALGARTPADETKARAMAAQAINLARQANRLQEAKDLLEEALNKWPDLRQEYEYQLKLWHCGIVM